MTPNTAVLPHTFTRPAAPLPAAVPASTPALTRVPRHLALVLDSRGAGNEGADALPGLQETALACLDYGVEYLSVFVPNTNAQAETLSFPAAFMDAQAAAFALRGIRLQHLAADGLHEPAGADEDSSVPCRMTLTLAAERDGREDLVAAVRRLAEQRQTSAGPELLRSALPTAALPPIDLLVRTGGSQRLSAFLLWHAAYAELLFVETPWAQFRRPHLAAALQDYNRRNRTFGALPGSK